MVLSREALDDVHGGLRAPTLDQEREHLQPGDPAFGALLQGLNCSTVQLQACRPPEEISCLIRSEPEVALPNLGDLPATPEAWQGEGRVRAGRDDDVQPDGQVIEQEADDGVDLRVGDRVIVVQHEHDAPTQVHRRLGRAERISPGQGNREVVDQIDDQWLQMRHLRRLKRRLDIRSDPIVDLLQRGDEVAEETGGLAVGLVQRKPRHSRLRRNTLEPRSDKRRLAVARGS